MNSFHLLIMLLQIYFVFICFLHNWSDICWSTVVNTHRHRSLRGQWRRTERNVDCDQSKLQRLQPQPSPFAWSPTLYESSTYFEFQESVSSLQRQCVFITVDVVPVDAFKYKVTWGCVHINVSVLVLCSIICYCCFEPLGGTVVRQIRVETLLRTRGDR